MKWLLRKTGRILLSWVFISGGLKTFKEPARGAEAAAKLGLPEPELAVRFNAAAMVAGGAALALGIAPKLAAAGLVAALVPTTLAGHRFWEEDDERARAMQLSHFIKNAGLIGGLLTVIGAD